MSTPPFPHEPLSAEEREIANCLGRLAPMDGPSAVLDARILSAARAATPSPAHAPRWPALLGIAATLAIAVGLAWQLRPANEALEVQHEAPTAAAAPEAPSRSTKQAAPASETASGQAVLEAGNDAAPPTAQRSPGPTLKTEATPPSGGRTASPRDAAKLAGQVAAPDPAGRDLRPPTMPAATSEPAPQAFPAAPPPPMADMRQQQATVRDSRDAATAQEAAAPSPAAMSDGMPEAEPRQPDAWVAYIRQRRDAGDVDGARDSLERLLQAHPDFPLPDDLRPLLDTPGR